MQSDSQILNIIHFNDVYDIEPTNSKGGVARFFTALQKYQETKPMVLFSGDIFSPSHLSNIHKGKQMIYPFNKFNITASCFGNHDFDFELEHVLKLKNETNSPWIMSNVFYAPTKEPLGEGIEYMIIERNNMKIGLMGLAEPEWLGLLVYEDADMLYEDFVKAAKKYCKLFKEEKCDLIIALTHMRTYNDDKLALEVPEIDLILGGHDHIVYVKQLNQSIIMKSGCNFNEFHYLTLDFTKSMSLNENDTSKFEFTKFNLFVELVKVDSKFEENPDLKQYVDQLMQETEKEMEKTQGYSDILLDTRFSIVRSQETPICNFCADLMRFRYDADVAIVNNGFLRSDCLFDAGKITYKMMAKMVPVLDGVCMLEVSGKTLLEALENGVSKYPAFDGRFPSVSGIKFTFDPTLPPLKRILKESIVMEKGEFKDDGYYTLVVKAFLLLGKDGYEVLKDAKRIIDIQNATIFQNIVNEFFDLPNSHFLKEGQHNHHDPKHEKYIEKWKKLIHSIKTDENGRFVVIHPLIEGRITIAGR